MMRLLSFLWLVTALPCVSTPARAGDGSVVAWGWNYWGQCAVPAPNEGFATVSAGGYHSLGLREDGSIVAWGRNSYGQCNVPSPDTGFVAVAAGWYHSLGLKADGSIRAWGYGGDGQCALPTPNTGFTAIAGGYGHSLGLKADGSILAWGRNDMGQCNVPAPNAGFTSVAAGALHSLGLKSDGSIVAWGSNSDGQCTPPDPNTGFVALATSNYHNLALRGDGVIVAWGRNGNGQCNVPLPDTGFVAIAAGGFHSLGLKADSLVVAWGSNNYGQCAVPTPNAGFAGVAAGGHYSVGRHSGPLGVYPQVTVITPNGGEELRITHVVDLGWQATDDGTVVSVELAVSRDGGATYATIASGVPNTGSYAWTVTSPEASNCRLRVTAVDDQGLVWSDMSDADWTIRYPPPGDGPNAGGVLVVHDTGLAYSIDTTIPPVTTPPASCSQVDNTCVLDVAAGSLGWIWKVYAAFPAGSSPRLQGLSWGIAFPSNGDGYVSVLAAGLPNPADFEVTQDGWPGTSGASIGESFPSGTRTDLVTELYWFAGYGYGGTGAYPQMFRTQPHSIGQSVFFDDSPIKLTDPIAGYGCLGFGQPGNTPCPPELGACCEFVGTCTLAYETDCTSPSATWHGAWVVCTPNPCVPDAVAEVQAAKITTLRAEPNPFAGRVSLRVTGSTGNAARVVVFDSAGRQVSVVWEGVLDERPFTVAWDGRDSSRRDVPAGVYLVRLETSQGAASQRLVKTR